MLVKVLVREIHFSEYQVDANSIEEAVKLIDSELISNVPNSTYIRTEYSETLEPETWLVETDNHMFVYNTENKEWEQVA